MALRSRLVTAMVMSVTLWGATASAAERGWGGHDSGGWILRNLALSDAQKADIRQVFKNHRTRLQTLHQQLGTAGRGLRDRIYSATPPTAADLTPIGQLRDSLAQERLQMALEIRALLTPAQLAKAQQLQQQMAQLEAQMRALVNPGP